MYMRARPVSSKAPLAPILPTTAVVPILLLLAPLRTSTRVVTTIIHSHGRIVHVPPLLVRLGHIQPALQITCHRRARRLLDTRVRELAAEEGFG